jgi:hypothetical protein
MSGGVKLSPERAREIFEHFWRLRRSTHPQRPTNSRISTYVASLHQVSPRTVRDIAMRRTWKEALPPISEGEDEEPGLADSMARLRALDPLPFF